MAPMESDNRIMELRDKSRNKLSISIAGYNPLMLL